MEKKQYRFHRPFVSAAGEWRVRDVVELEVMQDGVKGVGEAAPLAGWGSSDADDVFRELTQGGALSPCAEFAMSTAWSDLAAKKLGLPLWRYLQQMWESQDCPLKLQDTWSGEADVRAGFRVVKLKVGLISVEAEEARLLKIRDRFPELVLRLDANRAWTFEEAEALWPTIEAIGADYVEEPCERWEETLKLRGKGVRIALDESVNEWDQVDWPEVLVLKPGQLGGFEQVRNFVNLARGRDVEVVFSSSLDSIGRVATAHLARGLGVSAACGIATGNWIEDGIRDPLNVGDEGVIWQFPEVPGLGLEALK